MSRVAQITDDVKMQVALPATTEEWLPDLLADTGVADWLSRSVDGQWIITLEMGGNTSGLSRAATFLRDLDEALDEGNIAPMQFSLSVVAVPS